MKISLKTFAQLIEDMAAALQGSASALVDVSTGSVTRALFEANASIALWMQWLILQVLQTTRASTSSGVDLDSWMADFGLVRLAATQASGLATFSRYAADLPVNIPAGTGIKTSDGSLTFTVRADSTSSIWDANQGAYVLPAGVSSAAVPVLCNMEGEAGNILAGTLTVVASSLPGVDQVTNLLAFSGGLDAETDQAFRQRFLSYLAGLSRATRPAILSAVSNVQQGLNVALLENAAPDGTARPGSFLVIVDDGSGYPPQPLLTAIANAVDVVRPVGTVHFVCAPHVITIIVVITIAVSQSATFGPDVQAAIQQTVGAYISNLDIGKGCSVTRVAQCAYAASPFVDNVASVTLNGNAGDVLPSAMSVLKPGSITVIADAT